MSFINFARCLPSHPSPGTSDWSITIQANPPMTNTLLSTVPSPTRRAACGDRWLYFFDRKYQNTANSFFFLPISSEFPSSLMYITKSKQRVVGFCVEFFFSAQLFSNSICYVQLSNNECSLRSLSLRFLLSSKYVSLIRSSALHTQLSTLFPTRLTQFCSFATNEIKISRASIKGGVLFNCLMTSLVCEQFLDRSKERKSMPSDGQRFSSLR